MTKFKPVAKKGSEKTPKTSPAPGSGYGFFAVINIKPVAEASIRFVGIVSVVESIAIFATHMGQQESNG